MSRDHWYPRNPPEWKLEWTWTYGGKGCNELVAVMMRVVRHPHSVYLPEGREPEVDTDEENLLSSGMSETELLDRWGRT